MAKKSDLWRRIRAYLFKVKAIGPAIQLSCECHTRRTVSIETIDDFKKLTYGKSEVPCAEHIDCGHPCSFEVCHPVNHQTTHRNSNNPEIFRKAISDVKKECGQQYHRREFKQCHEEFKELMPECGRTLKCGHKCLNKKKIEHPVLYNKWLSSGYNASNCVAFGVRRYNVGTDANRTIPLMNGMGNGGGGVYLHPQKNQQKIKMHEKFYFNINNNNNTNNNNNNNNGNNKIGNKNKKNQRWPWERGGGG